MTSDCSPGPFRHAAGLVALLVLAACGGSDDDGRMSPTSAGFFYDSTVEGLVFSTPSRAGATDADGRFLFLSGESVSFGLCGVGLGSAVGQTFVSPLEIVPGAADVTDRRVTNRARLLIGLDDDGNSAPGIKLQNSLCSGFPAVINFDVDPANFRSSNPDLDTYLTNRGITLPTAVDTQTHLNCSRQDVVAGRRPDGICGAIPALSINDVSAVEGDSGSKVFNFKVSLSSATPQTVTVSFATADGTATAGSDYVAASGTVTFNPNDTVPKDVNVTVNGDTDVEGNETFFVNLSNPANATLADGQGLGTIIGDDAPPGQSTFSIDDVSEPEGDSGTKNFAFTVTRGGDDTITATVDVATSDVSATAGEDYEAVPTTTQTFDPNVTTQVVNVTVNGDTTVENDETFEVNLSNPSGNASIVDGQGIGTIENDDDPAPPPPPQQNSLIEFLFDLVLGLLGQDNPVTEENCIEQGSQVDPSGGQGAEQFCNAVFGVPAPPQNNEECRAAAEGTPFAGEQADAFCEAVFGPGEPPPPGGGQVRAGVGVVDMTPDVGYGAGQYTDKSPDTPTGEIDPFATHKTQKKSYGVQSRLTARAIVVEGSNGRRVALVKTDNYLAQDMLMRRVGQILDASGTSGVRYEDILHSVTHNHSSTYLATLSWGVWLFQDIFDPRFFENQARKIAEAIEIAAADLKPARMGATTVRHTLFKGNVVGTQTADDGTPAGYPLEYGDHGLVVIRFDALVEGEGEEQVPGDPIAVWVNWGEHPESLDDHDLHSADFLAGLERFVERDIGVPLVFSQGDVGSAERSGNTSQMLADNGEVCGQWPRGAGAPTADNCEPGEGVIRDFDHNGYVQAERNVRYLADAVVQGFFEIGELTAQTAGPGQVPFTSDFPVAIKTAWVPGPLSHIYPSVSNCRTDPTVEGDTGVPILGLPDCERFGVPGANPVNDQLAMIVNTMQAEGVPIPDQYDAPSFTGVQENLRLQLQAVRMGDILLASCACEAQNDLILNLESRADNIPDNIYDGFDWACVAEDLGLPDFTPRDPDYEQACDLQRQEYYDVSEFPTPIPGNNFNTDAIKRMRKQVHNDARGWDLPENALIAGTEPANPDDIWGNFTKEEIQDLGVPGYRLVVGVGHAGDYNGYTVSYREYQNRDHYRKALTSHGPHTADYMVTRLVRMGAELQGGPPLAPEPHDALAQADEVRQVAASQALGLATGTAFDAYYTVLPPDLGPRVPLDQPQDTSLFDAATFTWRGGSTAVDNPNVVVERCSIQEGRDCNGGEWQFFADQSGEVQTRVQWPEGIPGVLAAYTAQHEWRWTANFEAYDPFPVRLGGTPPGFYRFVVNGCINDGSAPDQNFSNRVLKLFGMGGDPACLGGATFYTLTSDVFEVFGQSDLVESVTSDANGDLTITVSATSVPRTYDSVFPFIEDDGGTRFCETCTFRPWAASDAPALEVTVEIDGQTFFANGSGTSWGANVGLPIGGTALVTATYQDGRVSRTFEFTRSGTPPPDRDNDGVPDIDDDCPDDPGPASNNGCPEEGEGFPVRFDELCAGPGCLSDIDVLGLQAVLDEIWNTLVGGGTPGGLPDQCDPSGTAPDGSRCLSDIPVLGELFGDGGGDPPAGTANASCTNGTDLDGGRSYQVTLPTYDDQTLSFQVLEPTSFDCANIASGAHPLMLHGPGYSGSRSTSGFDGSGTSPDYRGAGYTIISWDPRGFGDSTGTVRVMDPEFEGQYLLQILDWAEDNLDYLAWRDESDGTFMSRPMGADVSSVAGGQNLVVGAHGGSYGGGYQLLILATDNKKRLDAVQPDITWHDLRNSLNPGDVIKSLWDVALSALGEGVGHSSGGAPTEDGQDPLIKETLVRGASTNEWPRTSLDWFHYRGLGYWCAAAGLPAMPYPAYGVDEVPFLDPTESYNVPPREADGRPGLGSFLALPNPDAASHFVGLDVLLTQGMPDTLFTFNEAWWNTQCLRAAGANVSLYTHNDGHALPVAQAPDSPDTPVDGGSCPADELAWFDSKLKPDKPAAPRDEVCMVLANGDNVSFVEDTLLAPQPELTGTEAAAHDARFTMRDINGGPVPNGLFAIANTSGNLPVEVPLGIVQEAGVFAGVPHINVTVESLGGLNEQAQDCSDPAVPVIRLGCDSIIFAGIGIRKAGSPQPTFKLMDDQLQPLRGLGRHDVDLVGVAERLNVGDELALLLYGAHTQFFSSYSRDVTIPAVNVTGSIKLPIYAVDGDGNPDTDADASAVLGDDEPPPPPPAEATEGYGTGILGAIAEFVAELNEVIIALFNLDMDGAGTALQVALTDFGNNLSGLEEDAGSPGSFIGLHGEPDEVIVQALSAARAVEPVVLTGAQIPGWSQPAAAGIAQNHFSGFENFTGATEPGYGPRDAHAGIMLYPPNWAPGDAATNIGGGAPVENIAAFAWRDGEWKETRVQVDERYPYFLANGNSTFSFYSGIDPEISYAWDVEGWGMTKGICSKEYDPDGIDVEPRPGLYMPLTPGADPNRGVSQAIPDPIAGLDNDDEIVFMAGDAGEPFPGVDFPADWDAVQLVQLNDPLNPAASGFVYLVQRAGGSSFDVANGYVKYDRNANADQWIDRSFFEGSGVEADAYERNALGTSNTGYGPNLDGTVCPGWSPSNPNDVSTARQSTAHDSEGGDRFPRDGVVVTTDTYRWEATGRWMVRDLRVRDLNDPTWDMKPERDLLDRWKGRAFQQSPDSTISLVGFEDEQVNWEANSSLLGELCGPVRCIREVWGADSGTNVTKVETFYRDAITYRYHVRVHPIPPDGLYTSWDYNRSAMVPTAAEQGAGMPGGRYYTMLRPQGVPIDGINDDIGQMDVFPGCRAFYDSEASGSLLPVLAQLAEGAEPVTDQVPFFGVPSPNDLESCAAFFDTADPTFNLALGFENWEQVSGKGNLGSLVYIFEMTGPTSALNPLVVPYYRDDACLDDGTGDDPVWRPWPGDNSGSQKVRDAYSAVNGGTAYEDLRCDQRQGAHASHGIHYFFTHDSDNAFSPVTTTEIDGMQWQFMVPTVTPQNIAEPYANTVRARLVPVVLPILAPGGGGGWIGDPGLIGINPDTQCGSLLGFEGCTSGLPP